MAHIDGLLQNFKTDCQLKTTSFKRFYFETKECFWALSSM